MLPAMPIASQRIARSPSRTSGSNSKTKIGTTHRV
jgi:hypothetical protein